VAAELSGAMPTIRGLVRVLVAVLGRDCSSRRLQVADSLVLRQQQTAVEAVAGPQEVEDDLTHGSHALVLGK
jgi:hypothetical protein